MKITIYGWSTNEGHSAVGGYAFGDSAPAARRLGPPGRRVRAAQPRVPGPLRQGSPATRWTWRSTSAAGPGTPPGWSPRWVGARRTLGLDQSGSFVALAAAGAPPGGEFAVHDVTVVPFPCPPDRARLRPVPAQPPARPTGDPGRLGDPARPRRAAAGRRGRPDPHHPAGPARLSGHGGRPARLPRPQPGDRRQGSTACPTAPWGGPAPGPGRPAFCTHRARAAKLHAQNLAVWRDNAVDAGIATEAALARLAADLARGRQRLVRQGTITWELRQLAFQRTLRVSPACSSAMMSSHRSRHRTQMAADPCEVQLRPLSGSHWPQKLQVRPG